MLLRKADNSNQAKWFSEFSYVSLGNIVAAKVSLLVAEKILIGF
jgi:hypothetical protein